MKIKQHFNVVDLPTNVNYEMPSGERMAAGARGYEGIGKGLASVGSALTDFVQEKIRIDNELDFASSMNEFRQRAKDATIQLEKNPNEETHIPNLETALGKIQGDIVGRAKRKEVQVALQKSFASESASVLNAGRDFAFKTYLAKAGGKYAQTLFEMQQQYVSTDELNRKRISGEAETLIKATAISLGRDPDTDIRSWYKDTATGAAKTDAIVDPVGTKQKIQTGYYKGIPEVDKPALVKMCEQLEREKEAAEQKVKIDTVSKDLMDRHENDFDSMFKELSNTKFLKDNKLTVQDSHDIETVLRSKQHNYINQKNSIYEKNGREVFGKLINGTLTAQELNVLVAQDKLTDAQGRVYLNAIEERVNAGANPKTDFATYTNIDTAIRLRRVNLTEGQQLIMSNLSKLSEGDRKALMNTLLSDQTKEVVDGFKDAFKYLESQLIPQRGITAPFVRTPGEEANYYGARKRLDEWVEKKQKAGVALTSQEIMKEANNIANDRRKSMAELMVDYADWLKSSMSKEEMEKAKNRKILTPQIAAHFLQLAGGDKEKARKLAKEEGYKF